MTPQQARTLQELVDLVGPPDEIPDDGGGGIRPRWGRIDIAIDGDDGPWDGHLYHPCTTEDVEGPTQRSILLATFRAMVLIDRATP